MSFQSGINQLQQEIEYLKGRIVALENRQNKKFCHNCTCDDCRIAQDRMQTVSADCAPKKPYCDGSFCKTCGPTKCTCDDEPKPKKCEHGEEIIPDIQNCGKCFDDLSNFEPKPSCDHEWVRKTDYPSGDVCWWCHKCYEGRNHRPEGWEEPNPKTLYSKIYDYWMSSKYSKDNTPMFEEGTAIAKIADDHHKPIIEAEKKKAHEEGRYVGCVATRDEMKQRFEDLILQWNKMPRNSRGFQSKHHFIGDYLREELFAPNGKDE